VSALVVYCSVVLLIFNVDMFQWLGLITTCRRSSNKKERTRSVKASKDMSDAEDVDRSLEWFLLILDCIFVSLPSKLIFVKGLKCLFFVKSKVFLHWEWFTAEPKIPADSMKEKNTEFDQH